MLGLTAVAKDALSLLLWPMRDERAHQVVGKGDHENEEKHNLGLRHTSR